MVTSYTDTGPYYNVIFRYWLNRILSTIKTIPTQPSNSNITSAKSCVIIISHTQIICIPLHPLGFFSEHQYTVRYYQYLCRNCNISIMESAGAGVILSDRCEIQRNIHLYSKPNIAGFIISSLNFLAIAENFAIACPYHY